MYSDFFYDGGLRDTGDTMTVMTALNIAITANEVVIFARTVALLSFLVQNLIRLLEHSTPV
jgi:hypothetical protein